ncbi:hypothetical protein [Chryseobacterium sp. SL1]|uniref:hypothetical protein n=1 Tax=Chryseobacterium sp. SL1 TaxID=2995159 RepID=UPI002274D361|nr:hypothetical protein [Chryseobacterium sp. SL1]MCY1661942.1 hypothetical protein [Chryseobacterium sp. SL1]
MKKILLQFAFILINISVFSQVGINTTSPDKNSMLDIVSTNKGLLIPRVNLTSASQDLNGDGDNNVANQPAGLMVFNTGSTFSKGFYYWNGTAWSNVKDNTTANPVVSKIDCANATLNPAKLTANTPYSGYLTVPYNDGNGGTYSAGTAILSSGNTGLTATLLPGTLSYGPGNLTYKVTGVPLFSSPTLATFNLGTTLFTAPACSVSVGTLAGRGSDVSKIFYTGTTGDINQTLNIGGMVFVINNVPTPQVKLSTAPTASKTIYSNYYQAWNGGLSSDNVNLTFTTANWNTFQSCFSGGMAVGELNVMTISDPTDQSLYRVTFYVNGSSPYTWSIVAEKF